MAFQLRAAQQLGCAVLADRKRARLEGARAPVAAVGVWWKRLAAYLHSSAPLRHTYTKATNSSTTKTIVSIRAKVPNARSSIAIG